MASVLAMASIPLGSCILLFSKKQCDGSAKIGLSGLLGMATLGTLLGLMFLVPGTITGGPAYIVVLGMFPAFFLVKVKQFPSSVPKVKSNAIYIFAVVLLLAMALVGVLTPSTSLDWDSIAYHLAVPAIWVHQNHASSISFIHHSNFPGVVDSWFTVGELVGGQTAAKAFTWWFTIYGCLAIFGFVKERFNATSAWLCTVAFASIPMVMWESGTAYIDVANGLYAGFGFVFAAEYVASKNRSDFLLAAVMLSFAAGSKYTGLQAIFIASLVVLLLINKPDKLGAVKMGGLAAVLSSFWYIKNWILVGNPVYPFFYGVLGGKNWDKFNGDIYSEEQHTFGYHGVENIGSSILGLVTSPGRFTNPLPTAGGGFAFVSLGFAVAAGAVIGIIKGLTNKFEKSLALMIFLQLVAWFALSQQSRYILTLVVPMLFFFAKALDWKPIGKLVMGALAVQVVASIWIYKDSMMTERLPVLMGVITRDQFLGGYKLDDGTQVPGHVEFFNPAKAMEADPSVTKVALFDEVFGYYLDKPYFWAGPGHTTELDYAHITSADELIANMKKEGISHVYITNKFIAKTPEETMFDQAAGIQPDGTVGLAVPYSPDERAKRMVDERTKWRVLVAEAVAAKRMTLVTAYSRTRFLFKID
jgi:hypothetical protein